MKTILARVNRNVKELRPWGKFLSGCAKEGIKGFVYFNNDMNTRAPLNALRLMELVGSHAVQAAKSSLQNHRDFGSRPRTFSFALSR